MTRWLVDGMNVIGARPDGWWRNRPAAMRALVGRLGELARDDDEVAVIFDGRPVDVGPVEGVDVGFAPGGPNAADGEIARRVEADADPSSLTVVTSDAALAERVRAAGAVVTGAGRFRTRLDG